MRPTRSFLIALSLLAMACAPTSPRSMPGAMVAPSAVPERVVVPSVPTLEGMPAAVRIGLTVHPHDD